MVAAVSGAMAPPPSAAEVQKAASDVLADPDVQTELPSADVPTQAQPRSVERSQNRSSRSVGPVAQGIGQVLLIALIIGVVIALLAWLIGRARPGKDPLVAQNPKPGEPATDPKPKPQDLDPDHLARERKFREAIGALLAHAFAAAWPRGKAPASLTSREVLAQAEIAAPARGALADLVAAAEVCDFSPDKVTAADYDRVSDLYRVFTAIRGQRS